MDPRKKTESFELTDSFSVDIVLSADSVSFFLKFRAYELSNVINLTEYIYISPSLNQSLFGSHSQSSLYRLITSNSGNTFTVTDFVNENYFYKKNTGETVHYSCGSNEELILTSSGYQFKTSENIFSVYDSNKCYPKAIFKNIVNNSGLQYLFNYDSHGKLATINSSRTNTYIEYSYVSNYVSNLYCMKGSNTLETVRIIHDLNGDITGFQRIRGGTTLESISIIYSTNQIEVIDQKSTKRIRLRYLNDSLNSLTFGREGIYYEQSRINFLNNQNELIIAKPNNHFQYYKKEADCFLYAFDNFGKISKEIYEQKISDRFDSIRLTKSVSFNGNYVLSSQKNLFTNGYFENDLSGYVIDDGEDDEYSLISQTNTYYSKIFGNKLVNLVCNDSIAISKGIVSDFSPNRPYFFSFWYKKNNQVSTNVNVSIVFYEGGHIVDAIHNEIENISNEYDLFALSINCKKLFNQILISVQPSFGSNVTFGAFRLMKEDPIIKFEYENKRASLIKTYSDVDAIELEYNKNKTSYVSSKDIIAVFSKDESKSYNKFGGVSFNEYNANQQLTSIKTVDSDKEIYINEYYNYSGGDVVYHNGPDKRFENFEYQPNSDLLKNIDNGVINKRISINYGHYQIVYNISLSYVASEAISAAFTKEWSWSWAKFAGSVVGGAAGGFVNGIGGSAFIVGFVTGFVSTSVSMTLQKAFENKDYNTNDIILASFASGILSGILSMAGQKIIKINRISSGKGSFASVEKGIITKYLNGTIKNVAAKTMEKMFTHQLTTSIFDIIISGIDDAKEVGFNDINILSLGNN